MGAISKNLKMIVISFISAAACWFMMILSALGLNKADHVIIAFLWLFATLAAIMFSLSFAAFLIVGIAKKIRPESSPYRVFAVVVGSAGVLSFLYALYEIMIDKRLGSDFTGWAVLVYICPLILVIWFVDWKMWGKKN